MALEVISNALWEWDVTLSRKLASFVRLREPFKWIEWTLHGAPWLVGSSLLLITAYGRHWSDVTQHRIAILTVGLVVDLITTGVVKLSVQRRRPKENIDDMIYDAPVVDQFSFPSGHTSRCAMLITLWCSFHPQHTLFVWWIPLTIGASRVIMGRHYISDVLAGLLFGFLQAKCVLLLPMSFNFWLRKVLR